MDEILLEAVDVKKWFAVSKGVIFGKTLGWIKAVDGVTFDIQEGETFGLVGESGCGKTTLAKLVLRLERLTAGTMRFRGRGVFDLSGRELKEYRRQVQVVFQDPHSSLNPRMRVSEIIAEPILCCDTMRGRVLNERVLESLEYVGLHKEVARVYPHQLSGGQRQRVAVARALAVRPSLIVLDEPVSSLDVSVRAQIINLLQDVQKRVAATYLLISHDLGVVSHMSTRVAVMYLGRIVEQASSEVLYNQPLHPYTKGLLESALPVHPGSKKRRTTVKGEVASLLEPPSGCRFHPRCPSVQPQCSEVEPLLKDVGDGHKVACHL
ncbi:ABC transporter ATP-binding protein [Chloroflexota bacterium]